jgi:uncharacterized membrane protein
MYCYIVKVEISRLLQYQCLFNVLKSWPDGDLISLNLLSLLLCLVRHVRMILRKYISINLYHTAFKFRFCAEGMKFSPRWPFKHLTH